MCIEYHILVNIYNVSAQGVDERMINYIIIIIIIRYYSPSDGRYYDLVKPQGA